MKLLSLKALIATTSSGMYRKARTTHVATRRPMRTQADSTTAASSQRLERAQPAGDEQVHDHDHDRDH